MPVKKPEPGQGTAYQPQSFHNANRTFDRTGLPRAIKLACQINLQDPRSGAFQTPGEKTAQKKPGKPI
jgi:hypothetical protein